LEPTFKTLLALPRYRGHYYNWYDTRTLTPLVPAYISTVDSGNLVGYLMTLKIGLAGLIDRVPLLDPQALDGLGDAIALCEEWLSGPGTGRNTAAGRRLRKELAGVRAELAERPASLGAWRALLERLGDRLSAVGVLLREIEEATAEAAGSTAVANAGEWLDRAAAGVAERRADLDLLAPWTAGVEALGAALPDPGPAPTLGELVRWCAHASAALEGVPNARDLRAALDRSRAHGEELIDRAVRLGELADDLVEETEFSFLFNEERQLFSIGFSVTDGRLDSSYYDTFASEARLASFVAVATGQIPHEHWFKLGRSLTPAGRARALLSWSASMFEYFMPLLVMRAYPSTLLDETYRAVVDRQIRYGAERGVPWGISESAYNAQDLNRNYQYRAFGVPGLGLKRGLADDLVVAPYASILAAPLVPLDVLNNLERLAREGMSGRYGFYEAIDYTPERNPVGERPGVVLPTYMAHHQGMSLVALDNALHDAPMQQRFHGDPRVQAADLLLQEVRAHTCSRMARTSS
ncbi:MAG: cyclic beta 1-2 glucan synthetase, partial [Acidobacteria bacterium]|nr:cyclic beta 1-2 glucan synthetase [Acidobacteriota bacterium]